MRRASAKLSKMMVPTKLERRHFVRVAAAAASVEEGDCYKTPPPDVAQFVERPQSPGIR